MVRMPRLVCFFVVDRLSCVEAYLMYASIDVFACGLQLYMVMSRLSIYLNDP